MKDKWFYSIAAIFLVAFYFYNNPKVDFHENDVEGIQFQHENWMSALSEAKTDNKLIFVDVYATWCGPCKKLKKYTFSDKDVGDYFNANFINVALDAEKGEGISIANQYGVTSYPTVLIVDFEGNLVAKKSGYQNSADILTFVKRIVSEHNN